ncbi:MAG: hypothetical protein J6V57_04910, partial [Spirochaetaceae bacterium]|nr:hypothetical protein [Spirochaetaceae bacterium]
GIGKKLLEQVVLQLQEKGIRWIILADLVIPVFLQTCLTRVGFVSSGGGYILDTKGKIIATEDFDDAGANESLPDFFIGEKDA